MPAAANASKPAQQEVTLSRSLGLFTVTMIGVGGMIGAGIFVLTGTAAGVAGPALILAFTLNGIITSFTAVSYAELGARYPEAGGSYTWVLRALGGAQGFLAGWMSWFANAVAGSLYALAFGRFAVEVWTVLGLPTFGMAKARLTLIPMVAIVLVFTAINYGGASETGLIGNVVTLTKVFILGLFILFGLLAIFGRADALSRFTTDFMPSGPLSVLVAMGLTFIAFEGYEIIAQSGEEVIDPARNIPLAIFISIGVVVVIYLLVGISAIGAVQPPPGISPSAYLGQKMELAVVEVASQTFPPGWGGALLLISGLASTMSALNATTYSASRVSFAMGRDRNLPELFSRIHPIRHTPHGAVLSSGGLMLLIGLLLPLEDVAAAADIMFLLLFIQVNIAYIRLRRTVGAPSAGFRGPLFPVLPVLAIVANACLALYLVVFSQSAWLFALGWLVLGGVAYAGVFSRRPAMPAPQAVLFEQVIVSRQYSVLVPVGDSAQAGALGRFANALAVANRGEVLALHVIQVPQQLTLSQGRLLLENGRALISETVDKAGQRGTAVHQVIRLGRSASAAVRHTADENGSNLILLGWEGRTSSAERIFGSVIDPLLDDPPSDVAVLRYRDHRPLRSILVPVAGGPNSRLAVSISAQLARGWPTGVRLELLHVLPPGAGEVDRVRAHQVFEYCLQGIDHEGVETSIVEGDAVGNAILRQAGGHDLIVIGATDEPLFKNILAGPLPTWLANHASTSVMVVKRRSSRLQSLVRQALLEPSSGGHEQPSG